MHDIRVPASLHEVLGERQSWPEVIAILTFAIVGTALIYGLYYTPAEMPASWRVITGFILIADVMAGCMANFSHGTNHFYGQRKQARLLFILIHVHILLIAWLLAAPLQPALIIWAYTIVAALLVNALHGHRLQLFAAANLLGYGILLLVGLQAPLWLLVSGLFFMLKVMFSFAVDHYARQAS